MSEIFDSLSKYGQSFQSKTVSALITDTQMLETLIDIIKPEFFESESNKWIVSTILRYYSEYKKVPTLDVFKVELNKNDNKILKTTVKEQLRHIYTEVGNVDLDFIKKEFSDFCRNQNLKEVILQSVDLLKAGNYGKIKELVDNAMKIGTSADIGHNYINDLMLRMEDESRETVPTGLDPIDDLMGGGLSGGELAVIVAASGIGKCVGADTIIEIEYEEVGIELANGMIMWFNPWDIININDNFNIRAIDAVKIIEISGFGKSY